MVMLDDSGGKPLTGYGSGANSGSPVATPHESSAMLNATADALMNDFNRMCRPGGGYAFAGDFCQSVATESVSTRKWATFLEQSPSLVGALPYLVTGGSLGLGAKLGVKFGPTLIIFLSKVGPKAAPVVVNAALTSVTKLGGWAKGSFEGSKWATCVKSAIATAAGPERLKNLAQALPQCLEAVIRARG
jgi:hypothetical protein